MWFKDKAEAYASRGCYQREAGVMPRKGGQGLRSGGGGGGGGEGCAKGLSKSNYQPCCTCLITRRIMFVPSKNPLNRSSANTFS